MKASTFVNETWRMSGLFLLAGFLIAPFGAYEVTNSMLAAISIGVIPLLYLAVLFFSDEEEQFQGVWGTIAGKKPFDEFATFQELTEREGSHSLANKVRLAFAALLSLLAGIAFINFKSIWLASLTLFLIGITFNNIANLGYDSPKKNL